MATKAREVFRAEVPDVGLTLKVRSSIDGLQEKYVKRIREDAATDACLVDYSANVDWEVSFGDDVESRSIRRDEKFAAAPVFFETKYFFRGDFKGSSKEIEDVQIDHRLASVGDSFCFEEGVLVGTLDFINEPGRFRLKLKIIYKDGTWRDIAFEFLVVSVKVNILRDYDYILTTIEKEKPRLAQAFLGKSFWGAAFGGENSGDDRQWYQILEEVFAYYVKACERIVGNPHQRYVTVSEFSMAERVKRWTPDLVRQYARTGEEAKARLRATRIDGAVDTPENRFVLHTLGELARRLSAFADVQASNKEVSSTWIAGVRAMSEKLTKLSHHPFFAGVGRFTGLRQQSLVLQKQAGYAQVFVVWLKLKRALTPGGSDVDMSYRPISMLYEFWCFLKMREVLREKLGNPITDEVKANSEDDLLDTPELNDESKVDEQKLSKLLVVFEKEGVKASLVYQKTYCVRDLEKDGSEAFSSLNPQRPDIVLTLTSSQGEFSYLFDAKYRIWNAPGKGQPVDGRAADADATTRDAIDAMYRYRDAILYRLQKAGIKREIVGAYVLYPGRDTPHLYAAYRKTIEKEGIGAIPLLPNFESELRSNIDKILKRHTPAEHLKTATSVRGTSTVVGEAFSEASMPEIQLNGNEWPDFSEKNRCEVRVPHAQRSKITAAPQLVRLRSNNHAEIIVKLLPHPRTDASHDIYNIEWTPEGGGEL